VCDEERLSGVEPQNKALVSTAVIVIRKDSKDFTLTRDLQVALAILKRLRQSRASTNVWRSESGTYPEIVPGVLRQKHEYNDRK